MPRIDVWNYARELWADMDAAKQQSGKSPFQQIRDIARLRRIASRFGVSDYFKFRLYLDDPGGERRDEDFAGWRMMHWLDDRLNDPRWQVLSRDKLVMYALLSSCGLPTPRIYAVYEKHGRLVPDAPTLQTPAALAEHIRTALPFPCFAKPVYGDIGRGASSLREYDGARDELVLGSGERIGVESFVNSLHEESSWMEAERGYIFQEFIEQHPSVSTYCRHVATARIVVLVTDQGAEPFRAIWRVVAGNNMSDNYASGSRGNLLAALNLELGTVERVVRGYGLTLEELESHPDSNDRLIGFQLPFWDEAIELTCRGARIFPMTHFQHWDIAFGTDGPVVVEMNVLGSIDVPQIATGRGLYDEKLRRLVAQRE